MESVDDISTKVPLSLATWFGADCGVCTVQARVKYPYKLMFELHVSH